MKQRIEVRTQAEFDACVQVGNVAICVSGRFVAWGNSSVVARENVFIRLFSALKITASLHVTILLHGTAKRITGGRKLKAHKPVTAKQWCAHYGVSVIKNIAILFKAVNDDFTSPHKFSYAPGAIPVAPDWDGGTLECGGGLHFSPSPAMALEFHADAKRFVACPVKLADIAVHPDGNYPQKVKAKGCCGPVYEVDRKGKRI